MFLKQVSAILLKVAGAGQGERNQLTFWAASRVRDLVREGAMDHSPTCLMVYMLIGYDPREINSTITSALRGSAS